MIVIVGRTCNLKAPDLDAKTFSCGACRQSLPHISDLRFMFIGEVNMRWAIKFRKGKQIGNVHPIALFPPFRLHVIAAPTLTCDRQLLAFQC